MPRGRKVRNTNSVAAVWRTNARARRFFILVDAFFFSVGAFHFFLFFSLTRLFCGEKSPAGSSAVGACILGIHRERKWDAESAINDSLFSREGQFASRSKKEKARMIFWKKKKSLPRSRSTHVRRREREEKKPIDGWRFSSSLSPVSLSLSGCETHKIWDFCRVMLMNIDNKKT